MHATKASESLKGRVRETERSYGLGHFIALIPKESDGILNVLLDTSRWMLQAAASTWMGIYRWGQPVHSSIGATTRPRIMPHQDTARMRSTRRKLDRFGDMAVSRTGPLRSERGRELWIHLAGGLETGPAKNVRGNTPGADTEVPEVRRSEGSRWSTSHITIY